MTSELKPVQYIEEIVSGWPKNYAYKTVDPVTSGRKTVCLVRKITVNYSAAKLVNFGVIKDTM